MRVRKRADRSDGNNTKLPWPLLSVEIVEAADQECLARSFVQRAVYEGWASIRRGILELHTEPELSYEIVRAPGRFCVFCEAPLEGPDEAQAHLLAEHPDEKSPDPFNPAGWRRDDFFVCVKVS